VRDERRGITRKMDGLGFRSWPDRQCLKRGVTRPLWVELKRLGEKATKTQKDCHRMLRRMGQVVVVCDTLGKAKRAYDAHR
jgi:hypothetical protein